MEHRAYRKTWVLRSIHSIQNNFIRYSYTDFLDKTQIVYVIIFGIFYRNKTSHMHFYTFLTMTNKINYSVHFSPNNFWGKWQRFKYYRCCLGGSVRCFYLSKKTCLPRMFLHSQQFDLNIQQVRERTDCFSNFKTKFSKTVIDLE